MEKTKYSREITLKITGIIGVILYILFLIGDGVPLINNITFAEISVYLLFLVFLVGIFLLWKNLILSGITCILWHAIQWALVFWVWPDGALTLIFGFPIAIFGIVVLIIGIIQKRKKQ